MYWVEYYKNNGWELFNVSKPGSLGGVIYKWSKKALRKEANKYKTRSEFRIKNANAYEAARSKGIIDELFKNHSNQGYAENRFINGYWTDNRLQEEVNKYKTRGEFQIKNESAFQIAFRKGIIDELFKNHPNQGYNENRVIKGYWTNDKLQEEANKYKTINEFRINNLGAYKAAFRKGIIVELFKNHSNQGYTYNKK